MAITDTIIDILRAVFNSTDNSIKVTTVASLVSTPYDFVGVTYPSGTQEVYAFKSGGSGGTTVATVTVNYTDASKANLLNVTKT